MHVSDRNALGTRGPAVLMLVSSWILLKDPLGSLQIPSETRQTREFHGLVEVLDAVQILMTSCPRRIMYVSAQVLEKIMWRTW